MLAGNNPNCSRFANRYAIASSFFAAYLSISLIHHVMFLLLRRFSPPAPVNCDTVSEGRSGSEPFPSTGKGWIGVRPCGMRLIFIVCGRAYAHESHRSEIELFLVNRTAAIV